MRTWSCVHTAEDDCIVSAQATLCSGRLGGAASAMVFCPYYSSVLRMYVSVVSCLLSERARALRELRCCGVFTGVLPMLFTVLRRLKFERSDPIPFEC